MGGEGGTYLSLQAPVHSTSPHGFLSLISCSTRPRRSTCKIHERPRWALRLPPRRRPRLRGLAFCFSDAPEPPHLCLLVMCVFGP